MKRNVFAIGFVAAVLAVGAVALADKEGEKKAAKGAEVGKAAPAFELTGADGKTYKLSDFADKVVVLEWLSKDCPFSNDSQGHLTKMLALQAKYADKVTWLGVDSHHAHTAADNQQYAKEFKINYPILMDTDGKVGHAYGAKTTPHIFIINKGTLVYAGAPRDRKDENRQYAADAIDALLAGKDVPLAKTESWGCSVKYAK
ncbi:MAG: redoxin domain-containing protein [Phycisphaerales bacterium]|nr:redoxin domain-containing protein [Phycisphaerales bacterium]